MVVAGVAGRLGGGCIAVERQDGIGDLLQLPGFPEMLGSWHFTARDLPVELCQQHDADSKILGESLDPLGALPSCFKLLPALAHQPSQVDLAEVVDDADVHAAQGRAADLGFDSAPRGPGWIPDLDPVQFGHLRPQPADMVVGVVPMPVAAALGVGHMAGDSSPEFVSVHF